MFKKIMALVLVLVLCLALASCGGKTPAADNTPAPSSDSSDSTKPAESDKTDDSSTPSADYLEPAETTTPVDEGDPVYGGVAKVAVIGTIANPGYTPMASNNASLVYTRIAYESLLAYDADGVLQPMLAESYTTDPDEPSITWKLKQGVTFADGEPFNAEAVKINVEEYQANNRSEVMNVVSMDIINDYEIKMVLGAWNSSAVEAIGFYVLYMSPKALENVDALSSSTCGTGPFQLSEFTTNISAKYTKNENYWQDGKPYMDGIEIWVVGETTTMESAFVAGEYDIVACEAADLTENIRTKYADKIESGEFIRIINTNGQGLITTGMIPASADPDSPFHNQKVRLAMAYAIDEKALVNAFTYGTAVATNQWAIPGMVTYNSEMTPVEYNPERARELLAEAGYPDGFDTTIHTSGGGDMYTAIAAMLTEVGIRTTVNVIDGATFFSYMAGTWEGITVHAAAITPDLGLYMGRHLGDDATFYAKGIDRPREAVELLEKVRTAKTEEEKIQYEMELQDLIYNGEDGLMLFGKVLYAAPQQCWKHNWIHNDTYCVNFNGCSVGYADTWLTR